MKLQGMSILYIIIIIPMLIVISLTLSSYKDQLNNKIKYDSELTGAVNDAITAFELNSASQDFSNVSDNFTSLVEASVNIFRRSISSRLNMANADENLMNRYFPLALFTGYSGYYIYSPTYSPVVVKNPYTGQAAFSSDITQSSKLERDKADYEPDEDAESLQYTPVLLKHKDNDDFNNNSVTVTTNKDLSKNGYAKEEIDYSLKQMIPYTVELEQDSNNNVLINFTLDNYISLVGKVKGITYNKSGFLLNSSTSIKLEQGNNVLYDVKKMSDDLVISDLTYFDEYVDDYLENEIIKNDDLITLTVKENNDSVTIVFNPKEYKEGHKDFIADKREEKTGQYAYQLQQLNAIKYYIKAANFSNFVYKNLNMYKESHIKDIALEDGLEVYNQYFLEYDKNNSDQIFPTDKNILDYDSTFNEIKRKVIRNSVQYDLIIATENYNFLVSSSEYILSLPVITDSDWERIIENISFTAFLQGLSIANNKDYNDYAIATSTMNEFVINPDTIFFSSIEGFNKGDIANLKDDELYYHKIDCPDFLEYLLNNEKTGQDESTGAIGFKMGEWIYDARWSREKAIYQYDHKNYSHFNCINNYNTIKSPTEKEKEIIDKNVLAAVAAEKETAFKSNKIVDGGGYKTSVSNNIDISNIHNIKGFELSTENDNKVEREYSIIISAKSKSINIIRNQNSSVMAYPSNTTEIDKSKYEIHRDFISILKSNFGNGVKWNDINNIEISVSPDEEISYIKALYI